MRDVFFSGPMGDFQYADEIQNRPILLFVISIRYCSKYSKFEKKDQNCGKG